MRKLLPETSGRGSLLPNFVGTPPPVREKRSPIPGKIYGGVIDPGIGGDDGGYDNTGTDPIGGWEDHIVQEPIGSGKGSGGGGSSEPPSGLNNTGGGYIPDNQRPLTPIDSKKIWKDNQGDITDQELYELRTARWKKVNKDIEEIHDLLSYLSKVGGVPLVAVKTLIDYFQTLYSTTGDPKWKDFIKALKDMMELLEADLKTAEKMGKNSLGYIEALARLNKVLGFLLFLVELFNAGGVEDALDALDNIFPGFKLFKDGVIAGAVEAWYQMSVSLQAFFMSFKGLLFH